MRSNARRCALTALAIGALVLAGCDLGEYAADADLEFGMLAQGGTDREFNIIAEQATGVTNHAISWNVLQPTPTRIRTTGADALDAFATEHDLTQTAFHFAWDQALLDDMPAWVSTITDPDELRAVLAARAALIFGRYPGIDRIDVINEPFELSSGSLYENHFHQVLGPDYITELFDIVDAYAPATTELIVNENFVEYFPAKADALVALVEQLVGEGVEIDGVGLQAHLMFGEPDWDLLADTIERLGSLGVDVHFTELDVPIAPGTPDADRIQVDRYARALSICLAEPACRSITVWGVTDAATWYDSLLGPGQRPLLFDEDFEPKPAFFAVAAVLLANRDR